MSNNIQLKKMDKRIDEIVAKWKARVALNTNTLKPPNPLDPSQLPTDPSERVAYLLEQRRKLDLAIYELHKELTEE